MAVIRLTEGLRDCQMNPPSTLSPLQRLGLAVPHFLPFLNDTHELTGLAGHLYLAGIV